LIGLQPSIVHHAKLSGETFARLEEILEERVRDSVSEAWHSSWRPRYGARALCDALLSIALLTELAGGKTESAREKSL
jgi:hypothetical protein